MRLKIAVFSYIIVLVMLLCANCQTVFAATANINPLKGYLDTDLFLLSPEDAGRARIYLSGEGINANSQFDLYLSGAQSCDSPDSYLSLYFPKDTIKIGVYSPYWEGATTPMEDADKAWGDFEFVQSKLTYDITVGQSYQEGIPAWWSFAMRNNQSKTLYRYFHNTVLNGATREYQDVLELGLEFQLNNWRFQNFLAAGEHQGERFVYGFDLNARTTVGDQSFHIETKYEDQLNVLERHLNADLYWSGYTWPFYYGADLSWNIHQQPNATDYDNSNSDYDFFIAEYFLAERLRIQFTYGGYQDFFTPVNSNQYYKIQCRYKFNNQLSYEGQYKPESDAERWFTRFTHTLIYEPNLKNHIELSYSNQAFSDYTLSDPLYNEDQNVYRLSWKYYF